MLDTKRGATIALISLLACVIGCSYPPWTFKYEGQGTFTDHGTREPNIRYSLDVGVIDSTTKSRLVQTVGPLPKELFTLGFVGKGLIVTKARFANSRRQPGDPTVRVRVYDLKTNDLEMDASGCIGEWNWTDKYNEEPLAFVYKNGSIDGSQLDKTVEFRPKGGRQYKVVVEILEPSPEDLGLGVRITGGGWY